MPLDISLTAFAIFVVILVGIIYYKRRSLTINGILIMYKTQRGKDTINELAAKWPRFWGVFGNLGIAAVFISIILMVYLLIKATIGLLAGGPPAVALVLPGTGYAQVPGAILFPWYVWIIAIGIMFIPHELSHGIMCRRYKIKVKSVGLLLLAVLPGAFVEPDEKQLQKSSLAIRLRIYAVGSFINIVTAGIFFGVLFLYLNVLSGPLTPLTLEILKTIQAIVLVTLGVGLANSLPIYPLDGGKFFHDLVGRFTTPKAARGITITMSVFLALIIVFNIASPFVGKMIA